MAKKGFDNELYVKLQIKNIKKELKCLIINCI